MLLPNASVRDSGPCVLLSLSSSRPVQTDGDLLTQNSVFSFSSGILVCTDVMARGIDIPEVNWVLQYDPPSSARYSVTGCYPLWGIGPHESRGRYT